MKMTFYGGAGTVTGSKCLLEIKRFKFMIDCGLFQGLREQRRLNWSPLPFDPKTVSSVILTHAHLDHCGYLPLLVKNGFRGPIYCSEPTAELVKIVLMDAAHLEEEDAQAANKLGYSRYRPALPLFDSNDVTKTLPLLRFIPTEKWTELGKGIARFRLIPTGHILGSTAIQVHAEDQVVVFSGDLGREHPITLKERFPVNRADVLVVESTYGHRNHSNENPFETLGKIINETTLNGGQILIPAFAIGRTQDILFIISKLKEDRRVPNIPVYLDSPMAHKANEVFEKFPEWHRLSSKELKRFRASCYSVNSVEQSRFLAKSREPAIIIAGSGMLTGGRIRQHLVNRLSESKHTVILVGYQASGTLGRFLEEGAKEARIFGKYVPVKCRVETMTSLSAHADQTEIMDWVKSFKLKPRSVFIVHGEPHSSEGLRVRVDDLLGPVSVIPKLNETFEIEKDLVKGRRSRTK